MGAISHRCATRRYIPKLLKMFLPVADRQSPSVPLGDGETWSPGGRCDSQGPQGRKSEGSARPLLQPLQVQAAAQAPSRTGQATQAGRNAFKVRASRF